MRNTLKLLYDRFYKPVPMAEAEQEIEVCHRQLIERLEKPERKLVLLSPGFGNGKRIELL